MHSPVTFSRTRCTHQPPCITHHDHVITSQCVPVTNHHASHNMHSPITLCHTSCIHLSPCITQHATTLHHTSCYHIASHTLHSYVTLCRTSCVHLSPCPLCIHQCFTHHALILHDTIFTLLSLTSPHLPCITDRLACLNHTYSACSCVTLCKN